MEWDIRTHSKSTCLSATAGQLHCQHFFHSGRHKQLPAAPGMSSEIYYVLWINRMKHSGSGGGGVIFKPWMNNKVEKIWAKSDSHCRYPQYSSRHMCADTVPWKYKLSPNTAAAVANPNDPQRIFLLVSLACPALTVAQLATLNFLWLRRSHS